MGVKILRVTDRLQVKIGEVTLALAPLSLFQRQELLQHVEKIAGEDISDIRKSTILAMKYSIKEVKGLEDLNGEEYQVEFDDEGNLTEDCVTELLTTEVSDKMIVASYAMIYGMPNKIVDNGGKEIKGVEIVTGKSRKAKKEK